MINSILKKRGTESIKARRLVIGRVNSKNTSHQDMSKPRKPKDFLKTPQYEGGKSALKKYIDQNLKYPQEALDGKIEGAVQVEYFVDGLGKIKKVRILKGIGHGCNEEVIRLIESLVYQKAINRGVNTLTRKTLTINFNLPKKKPTTLKYQLVADKPKSKTEPQKKSSNYTITLKYNSK